MTVTAEQTALGIRVTEPLRLIAGGQSIKPIARSLGIALKTADNHVQNLYAKIGVKTRGGATSFAIEHGLGAVAQKQGIFRRREIRRRLSCVS